MYQLCCACASVLQLEALSGLRVGTPPLSWVLLQRALGWEEVQHCYSPAAPWRMALCCFPPCVQGRAACRQQGSWHPHFLSLIHLPVNKLGRLNNEVVFFL